MSVDSMVSARELVKHLKIQRDALIWALERPAAEQAGTTVNLQYCLTDEFHLSERKQCLTFVSVCLQATGQHM